jgi:hypothetical protein
VVGIYRVFALLENVSEPKIRIIGLILQISGIATVAWGLKETRNSLALSQNEWVIPP